MAVMESLTWLLLLMTAEAAGPWVLSSGDIDVYLGLEQRRSTALVGDGNSVDLTGDGLSSFGVNAALTAGIVPGVEGWLSVPWYTSRVLNPADERCATLGLEACRTSQGIGAVQARLRGLVLDELYGAPVSLTMGGELRLGELTADTRSRLTALGDGTTDLAGFAAVGRSGGLAEGVWSASLESGWRYRLKNDAAEGIPGNEVFGDVEVLAGTALWWRTGLVAYGLWRPSGNNLSETDFSDPERFVALRVRSVKVGGKLLLRNEQSWSLSTSVLRTVYAQNVPSDELIISTGLSVWRPAAL